MNITLSADEELINKSREYAKAHHTTLNRLIRNYLARISGGHDAEKTADEFVALARAMPGRSDDHYRFSRDDIYDRQ